jgi:hypothetical protein
MSRIDTIKLFTSSAAGEMLQQKVVNASIYATGKRTWGNLYSQGECTPREYKLSHTGDRIPIPNDTPLHMRGARTPPNDTT